MANSIRGDVDITLDDTKWLMRPTFEALAETEMLTGRSLQMLGAEIMHGQIRAMDLATIISCGIRASGAKDAPDINAVGAAMLASGFESVQQPVIDFLADVLSFYGEGQKKTMTAAAEPTASSKPGPK